MTLKNLFIKHKSDKYSHQYYKVYEKYLDKLKKKKIKYIRNRCV